MPEVIAAIMAVILCICSYFIGKTTEENKELKNETETINKGATAGDAAVRAFRLRKQSKR